MYQKLCMLALLGLLSAPAFGTDAAPTPRLLVHLLDYLAKDYAGAVGPNAQVLSASEYQEQLEFSHVASETSQQLPELADQPEIKAAVAELDAMIKAKAEPAAVSALSHTLQERLIALVHLEIDPPSAPDLSRGKELYLERCAVCHGTTGHGDGPGGVALTPKPANFVDPQRMAEVTPLHAFDTVRIGIPGTAMPSFPDLNDQDAWNVSYYVLSLLPGRVLPAWQHPLAAPAGGAPDDVAKFLDLARSRLDAAVTAYAAGSFNAAKTAALQAYLEGIEPIEPRIKASNPEAAAATETQMAAVRAAIEARAPLAGVQQAAEAAKVQMNGLSTLLQHSELSPSVAFIAASSIMLREGFEAVLLILALLGVIRASNSKAAAYWVHGGWMLGLGVGFAAWFASGYLIKISGAQREMMEAVTSLVAVAVLLVVGFWLHSRTEIGRWNRFLRLKVRAAVQSRSFFGLAMIAFLAVFREAFETVLFLRTIWLDSGESARSALGFSVFLTIAAIILAAWLLLRYSTKIPVRKLFGASAVVMAILAVILTGKGLHSLQETGALPVTTPLLPMRVELLGLFPSYETLVPQLAMLGLIGFLWLYGRRPSSRGGAASV